MYKCNQCGSENIEVRAWIKVNDHKTVRCQDRLDNVWCPKCAEIVSAEEDEIDTRTTYLVRTQLIYNQYIKIKADSKEDAVKLVNSGMGEEYEELEFCAAYRTSDIDDVEEMS